MAAAEVTGWLLELISAVPAERLPGAALLDEILPDERSLDERLLVARFLLVTLLDATTRLWAELATELAIGVPAGLAGFAEPPPQLIISSVARQSEGLIAQAYFISECSSVGFILWSRI